MQGRLIVQTLKTMENINHNFHSNDYASLASTHCKENTSTGKAQDMLEKGILNFLNISIHIQIKGLNFLYPSTFPTSLLEPTLFQYKERKSITPEVSSKKENLNLSFSVYSHQNSKT
ncbi:hypothetical protein Droror1_Dr00009351 [Drosera rotundifolia]